MRASVRPLYQHLAWLVLASLVPSSLVAGALVLSAVAPGAGAALFLMSAATALVAGLYATRAIARRIADEVNDIAVEAGLLARGQPMTALHPTVSEFRALADALVAASHRGAVASRGEADLPAAGMWEWDLLTGAMSWSEEVSALVNHAGERAPSSALMLALVHPGDRAELAAWLATLARGEEAEPIELRFAGHHVRATAIVGRSSDGTATRVLGQMATDDGEACPAMPDIDATLDVATLVTSVADKFRERARAAGLALVDESEATLGSAMGDAGDLEMALSGLIENVVTCTPRGGRITVRAGVGADDSLEITLHAERSAETSVDGMAMAGRMVELNCGALAVKRIEAARTLVEDNGGSLSVEAMQSLVSIVLPRALAAA